MTLGIAIAAFIFGVFAFFLSLYNIVSLKVYEAQAKATVQPSYPAFLSQDSARALTGAEDEPSIYDNIEPDAYSGSDDEFSV